MSVGGRMVLRVALGNASLDRQDTCHLDKPDTDSCHHKRRPDYPSSLRPAKKRFAF